MFAVIQQQQFFAAAAAALVAELSSDNEDSDSDDYCNQRPLLNRCAIVNVNEIGVEKAEKLWG